MTALALISFAAAVVNGALGYGFSSIAVPLALLVVDHRALNPALVLLELALNAYVAWTSRAALARVRGAATLVVVGLVPGISLGALALTHAGGAWLKLATFAVLLPLVLLQSAGFRRARRAGAPAALAFGAGLGALYGATTISGPPLSMFFGGQGYAKEEFRAIVGAIRFAAAIVAAMLYANAGVISRESLGVIAIMLPGVAIGLPVGAWVVRRVREETFRRASLSFDALVIALGLSLSLRLLHVVDGAAAFIPLAAVAAVHVVMMRRALRPPVQTLAKCAQPQLS